MARDAELQGLVREDDGSHTAAYGPFLLRSAFQPIYSQSPQGALKLEAFEALIRPSKGGVPVPPAQFFSMVEPGDGGRIERLCRRLHVLNSARMEIGSALLFLNFDPAFFTDYAATLQEIDCFTRIVRKSELSTSQIVCEIIETEASSRHLLRSLTDILREHNLKIAIDDYGAEDSDFERLISLKPDIVKFDGLWVNRFMETAEGFALLKVMVRQFRERGIQTLFEGLEEHWQIAACRDLGVRLLQGYALARPKIVPARAEAGPQKIEEEVCGDRRRHRDIRARLDPPARTAAAGRVRQAPALGNGCRRAMPHGGRGEPSTAFVAPLLLVVVAAGAVLRSLWTRRDLGPHHRTQRPRPL